MTRAEKARAVIETLDPLAVGEEVWFVYYEIDGTQTQKRGVVKRLDIDDDMAIIAVGSERPTMPSYQVCLDDITRDK